MRECANAYLSRCVRLCRRAVAFVWPYGNVGQYTGRCSAAIAHSGSIRGRARCQRGRSAAAERAAGLQVLPLLLCLPLLAAAGMI